MVIQIKNMKYLIAILIAVTAYGCAWFNTQNDSQIPTISAPPQKLNNHLAPLSEATDADKTQDDDNESPVPRIQEDRSNGVVDQIKVNNHYLPSYYIYPAQQDYDNSPNPNVVVPNWQISW